MAKGEMFDWLLMNQVKADCTCGGGGGISLKDTLYLIIVVVKFVLLLLCSLEIWLRTYLSSFKSDIRVFPAIQHFQLNHDRILPGWVTRNEEI